MAKAWTIEELTKNASLDFIAGNPAFGAGAPAVKPARPAGEPSSETWEPKLNKTETMYYERFLKPYKEGHIILSQCVRLPLTHGGIYIPDFVVITADGVRVIEIKGGYRGAGWEQGYERYKRAATEWHREWFRFEMNIFDRKSGKWHRDEWEVQYA